MMIGRIFCLHVVGFFGASKLTKSFGFPKVGFRDGEVVEELGYGHGLSWQRLTTGTQVFRMHLPFEVTGC